MMAGAVELIMLGNPHLMLANVAGNDRVVRCGAGKLAYESRAGYGRQRLFVICSLKSTRSAPCLALFTPVVDRQRCVPDCLGQLLENGIQVSSNGYICIAKLVEFRGVGVNVYRFCVRSEPVKFASGPIIHAGSDNQQKVALVYSPIGCSGTVHTQHAQIVSTVFAGITYSL